MAYTTRTVKSAKGLSQEKALITLQNHPEFKEGTRIASIYNQGGRWVAKLIEPKTAAEAFEDIDSDINESPAELHDEKHEIEEEAHEEHEEKHEQSEDKKLKELEKKLDLLLDALGISEKGESPDVASEGPVEPAAPKPPKGGPAGGPSKSEPLPPGSGAKLKPGEVPNKPGMTPVGSPAFASVQKDSIASTPGGVSSLGTPGSPSPAASTPAAAPAATSTCPTCGGVAGNCTCTKPAGTPNVPGGASPTASGPVTAFTASKLDTGNALTIRQAKAQLENEFDGFRVARIKRDGDAIHARLIRNDS